MKYSITYDRLKELAEPFKGKAGYDIIINEFIGADDISANPYDVLIPLPWFGRYIGDESDKFLIPLYGEAITNVLRYLRSILKECVYNYGESIAVISSHGTLKLIVGKCAIFACIFETDEFIIHGVCTYNWEPLEIIPGFKKFSIWYEKDTLDYESNVSEILHEESYVNISDDEEADLSEFYCTLFIPDIHVEEVKKYLEQNITKRFKVE